MIDSNAVLELEKLIFGAVKERRAAAFMADFVGVLIGVKPAMSEFLTEKEFAKINPQEFLDLMKKLGLNCVISYHFSYLGGYFERSVDFSIAKNLTGAVKIRDAFLALWKTMDEFGQTIDEREWRIATKKVGRLLGYPRTAIKGFLKDDNIDDAKRQERMARNRYYAHSEKHEREEFLSYDRPINLALEKYAKRSADALKADGKKRWTEY